MPISDIILECLKFVYQCDDISDRGFSTRVGVERSYIRQLIDQWPNTDDVGSAEDRMLAINNCLNEVCNGLRFPGDRWAASFSVSRDEVYAAYAAWSAANGSRGGWM